MKNWPRDKKSRHSNQPLDKQFSASVSVSALFRRSRSRSSDFGSEISVFFEMLHREIFFPADRRRRVFSPSGANARRWSQFPYALFGPFDDLIKKVDLFIKPPASSFSLRCPLSWSHTGQKCCILSKKIVFVAQIPVNCSVCF